MTLPLGYHDLSEALAERGCAVCRVVRHGATAFLDGLLYEYVNTPDVHRSFRAGRGLCNLHMWEMPTFRGVSLGAAILDAAVLDEILSVLDANPAADERAPGWGRLLNARSATAAHLADALEPTGPCLACRTAQGVEQRTIRTLSEHFDTLEAAFRSSDGLCLPHFRAVLRYGKPAQHTAAIVGTQRAIWEALKHELQEFQRKSDVNHAGEPMGAEGDSWIRAIGAIAGEQGALPDPNRT